MPTSFPRFVRGFGDFTAEVLNRMLDAINDLEEKVEELGAPDFMRDFAEQFVNQHVYPYLWFPAAITGYQEIPGTSNRWRYSWEEVVPKTTTEGTAEGTNEGQFSAMTGGRTSSSFTNPAYNMAETANNGAGPESCFVNVDSPLFTGNTFAMQPVRGALSSSEPAPQSSQTWTVAQSPVVPMLAVAYTHDMNLGYLPGDLNPGETAVNEEVRLRYFFFAANQPSGECV